MSNEVKIINGDEAKVKVRFGTAIQILIAVVTAAIMGGMLYAGIRWDLENCKNCNERQDVEIRDLAKAYERVDANLYYIREQIDEIRKEHK